MKRPDEIEPTFRQALNAITPPPEVQAIIDNEIFDQEDTRALILNTCSGFNIQTFFVYNGSEITLRMIHRAIKEISEGAEVEEKLFTLHGNLHSHYKIARLGINTLGVCVIPRQRGIVLVMCFEISNTAMN